jgi:hypothetical protein
MGRFEYKKSEPENKKRLRIELPESLLVWVENLANESGDSPSQVIEACVSFCHEDQKKKSKKLAKTSQPET